MKIITKAVINIETLETIYEESYEYDGPVAEAKGGGGGGAGAVSYPAYMTTIHNDWLDNTGADTITSSITDIMDAAQGNSPWTGETAYDPDIDITAFEAVISGFDAILAGLSDTIDWDTFYTQSETTIGNTTGISEAVIVADVAAFANQLDDEINTKVLPRFRAGMRNINAVISSAFPIGQAIIESFRDREVAKHDSAIRLKAAEVNANIDLADKKLFLSATEQILNSQRQRIAWEESYMKTVIEGKRIKIVAKKEENDVNLKIGEDDALWDLEVFQHGANLLAAIGGGTSGTKKPSTAQSMIGGGLSGATAGAMLGMAGAGPVGMLAGIGGVLGAASGLL